MTPKLGLTIIFFGLVGGYIIYQATGLVRQPTLIVSEPADGSTIENELLTLRGRTIGLVKILANGEKLELTENGEFETELLLARGYNIINLTGEDRFGRTINQKLQLVHQPKIFPNDEEK